MLIAESQPLRDAPAVRTNGTVQENANSSSGRDTKHYVISYSTIGRKKTSEMKSSRKIRQNKTHRVLIPKKEENPSFRK